DRSFESRKHLLGTLSGQRHVQGIRAQIKLFPCDRATFVDAHGLEELAVIPGIEHAAACQMAEIDLTFDSVRVAKPDSVPVECFYFDCFLHSLSPCVDSNAGAPILGSARNKYSPTAFVMESLRLGAR